MNIAATMMTMAAMNAARFIFDLPELSRRTRTSADDPMHCLLRLRVQRQHRATPVAGEADVTPAVFVDHLVEPDGRGLDGAAKLQRRAEAGTENVGGRSQHVLRVHGAAHRLVELRAAIAAGDDDRAVDHRADLLQPGRENPEALDDRGGRRVVDVEPGRGLAVDQLFEREVWAEIHRSNSPVAAAAIPPCSLPGRRMVDSFPPAGARRLSAWECRPFVVKPA